MKLLVDTDAFCKLGLAGLLPDAVQILGSTLSECERLPALPFMLRKGGLRNRIGAAVCDSLLPLAEDMPSLQLPSLAWLEPLSVIDDVDPGEAQLFAAAAEFNLMVLSGDKRALRAIANMRGLHERLAGSVCVVEANLLALCERLDPRELRERIAPLIAIDKMVEACFSSGSADPREGLRSYLGAIVAEVAPLILWTPMIGGGR